MTDLRAQHHPEVFGTDASLCWGGVVSSRAAAPLATELWRRSEHGGWHTRLCDDGFLAVLSRPGEE
eukprot:1830665-Pyramimonas_sp.AAC.1